MLNMEVIENQIGGQKLCYQGFTYTKKKEYGTKVNKIVWKCSQERALDCRARITTNGSIDSVYSSSEHSHDPDYTKIEAMKLKVELKKLAVAKKGKTPRELVDEVLASQTLDTHVGTGDIAAIEKLVRRYRIRKRSLPKSRVARIDEFQAVECEFKFSNECLKQEDASGDDDHEEIEDGGSKENENDPLLEPAEKYEQAKRVCKSLALLASQVPDEVFRVRLAVLQNLYENWMSRRNDANFVDEPHVPHNPHVPSLSHNEQKQTTKPEFEKLPPTLSSKSKRTYKQERASPNVTKLTLPRETQPAKRANINDAESNRDVPVPSDILYTSNGNDADVDGIDSDTTDLNDENHTNIKKEGEPVKPSLKMHNLRATSLDKNTPSTKATNIYPCPTCRTRFKQEHLLEAHMRRRHRNLSCKQCNKSFASLSGLHIHERAHDHAGTLNPDGTKRRFPCPECDSTLSDRRSLKNHIRSHRGERPYICNVCGNAYGVPDTLRQHMRLHTGEHPPLQCDVCRKRFYQQANLLRHKMSHTSTDTKRRTCDRCGKVFSHQSTLARHRDRLHPGVYTKQFRSHIRAKPASAKLLQCPICGKTVKTNRLLEDHMNSHTNTRPYKCEKCPKAFFDRSSLRKHVFRHSGILKHTCTVCGASFPFSKDLQTHMRTHSDVLPILPF